MTGLETWGWDSLRDGERTGAPGEPARVVTQERDRWIVRTAEKEASARLRRVEEGRPLPVVGDWVAVAPGPEPSDPFSIEHLYSRRSALVRGAAGSGDREQVLAANVDDVWIVHGLDVAPNLRRIERTLTVAWDSGAVPRVLLTKADLCDDADAARAEVARVAPGVAVDLVSADDPESLDALRADLAPGRTIVLLGPSGAGKSTLVNRLAESHVAPTGAVRGGDAKGRHTTTRRQLFQLQGGALVIDTPGIRELRLWEVDAGLQRAYPDIDALARECRFADCRHDTEPGCAVRAAAENGTLPADRLESFRKLQAEAAYERRRVDPQARKAALSEHKTALKTMRHHLKRRRQDG